MKTQLLSFNDYHLPAERLANTLNIPCLNVKLHRFPDGESRVQLPDIDADHLIVCRSLDQPNDKLIELMLVSETARQMGVKQLTLVAPYLCYMRQDIAFHPGEAVSQKIIGQQIACLFDNIVTVDPHLHRIHDLQAAVPCKQAITLSATRALGEFLASHNKAYVLIGPDEESKQWVSMIAAAGGFHYGIASKIRLADKQVEVTLPALNVNQADVVLVDDMISTGHTMLETAKKLLNAGARSLHCLVSHALFSEAVAEMLQQAGVESIWSTDTIAHNSNVIQMNEQLASGIRQLKDL